MNVSTTLELTCSTADAAEFMLIGFELTGQRTDGQVTLMHRGARMEHIISLVALARAGVPFVGQDEGWGSGQPYTFASADGRIVCATIDDCFADGGTRAALYADHKNLSEELMAVRKAQRAANAGAAPEQASRMLMLSTN